MTKSTVPAVSVTLPEDGIPPADYNKVVDSAELVTIQLRRQSFDVEAMFYDPTGHKKLSFKKSCLACAFDVEESTVAASFRFEIVGKSGRKPVLKSVADYLVVYEFNDMVDAMAAEGFCRRVGLYAAYPYYRALVAALSSSANLNLPPLPMIATRGVKLPQDDSVKEAEIAQP